MDQLWVVVLAIVGIAVVYVIARNVSTRARSSPGQQGSRGPRRVSVSTLQGRERFTVRAEDGSEKTYQSLDDMPYEVRCKFEEARRGGPTQTRIRVTRDGQTREYTSEQDLPPELRQRIGQLRAGGQGVTIEVDGETHHYRSPDDVPPHLRKFLRP